MRSPFERAVEDAILRGVDRLLTEQHNDGFWREFDLEPGPSECWATAWIGWCLLRSAVTDGARRVRIQTGCERAVAALLRARGPLGWGYNRRTGPDADTTAWVGRFLCDAGVRLDMEPLLEPYIDAGGGVHTFRELDFGTWTDAHDDVAANVGLALAASAPAAQSVERIRRRLIARFPVRTFWWSTQSYGIAWTLRFLRLSGGVPDHVRASVDTAAPPTSLSSFEAAHCLMIAGEIAHCDCEALDAVNHLLDGAGPSGWPGASLLLVPSRDDGPPAAPNPELRGLLTTAISVRALSEWHYRVKILPASALVSFPASTTSLPFTNT
jgi:hypothetical protein